MEKMSHLILAALMFAGFNLFCQKKKNGIVKSRICADSVVEIEMAKKLDFIAVKKEINHADTSFKNWKKLSPFQIQSFISKWNSSSDGRWGDFVARYWLNVIFKDGSMRIFTVNGASVKERGDCYWQLNDLDFFERIWKELK